MRVFTTKPGRDFTQIPHEVFDHPIWEARNARAAKLALLELYRQQSFSFPTVQKLAAKLGYKYDTFRKFYKIWEESGLVRRSADGLELFCFEDGAEPAELQEEKTIVAEVQSMPRTEVRLPKAERISRIKEAWDKHKPERFQESGRIHDGTKMAIDAHMKRQGIKSGEYEAFMAPVLRAAEDFDKLGAGIGPAYVFGNKQELEDWKFEQVDKLYKIGRETGPKVVLEDKGDDWYLAKALELWPSAPYKRVERRVLKTADQALLASEGPKMLNDIKTGLASADDHNVIVKKQKLVALQLNPQADPEWYNEEVLGLAFVQGKQFPLYWTSIDKLPRN